MFEYNKINDDEEIKEERFDGQGMLGQIMKNGELGQHDNNRNG